MHRPGVGLFSNLFCAPPVPSWIRDEPAALGTQIRVTGSITFRAPFLTWRLQSSRPHGRDACGHREWEKRVSEIVSLKLMFFVRSLHAMCRFQQVAHATEEAGIGRIRRPRFRPRASRKLSATRGVPQSMPV
jgi:hypothetical protein